MTTPTPLTRRVAMTARAPVLLALALTMGQAWGCATPQEPEQLRRASAQLRQEQTDELQSVQPRLLREARGYERQARQAYERGQIDRANLLAHRAVQSYETARLLMERHAAQRLTGLMRQADDGLDERLAEVKRQQEELRRFRELEARQSASPSNTPQGAAARRVVTSARQRQLAAISEGAPTAAPQRYNQGRMYVELAVEALDRGAFDEAQAHAQAATKHLDQAIAAAKEQAKADAPAPRPQTPGNPVMPPAARTTADVRPPQTTGDPLQTRAAEGVQRAAAARKDALQRGVPDSVLREADASLERAQQATQRGDHAEAIERAAEARTRFEQASATPTQAPTTPVPGITTTTQATTTPLPATTARTAESSQPARADALRERVSRQLIDLQVRRADALSRQLDKSCAGPFRAFESLTDAAKERARTGDDTGALELGVRASIALDGCADEGDTSAREGASSKRRAATTKRERDEDAREARARDTAAERIAEAQKLMASASARMSGDARLREPAMLITQAERWFAQSVWGQAEALATSARDRLKAILDSPPPSPSTTSTPGSRASVTGTTPATTSTAATARTATGDAAACEPLRMALVRVEIARADADKRPLTADLRADRARADRLVKTAESLAKQGQCQPAVQLVDESASMLTELARRAEAQAVKKATPDTTATRTAEPVTKTTPDATATRLDQVDKKLDTTSQKVDDTNKKLDALGQRSNDPDKKTSVNVVVTPSPTLKTGDKNDDKQPKPSEAQLATAREALAGARLSRARAEGQRASEVYRTADALLTEADAQLTKGQPDAATRLAKQASSAFNSLVKPPAKADDPARQPAYTRLLDAQIARDRATLAAGEAEAAIVRLGESNLKRAQDAWGKEDYVATGRFADAAKADFERAASAASARRDAEAKQAQATQDAASKQAQAARDAEAARAKQAEADRARQAETDRARQRTVAEDALREARIQQRRCDDAQCPRRDRDGSIRAGETLTGAQESFTRGDFTRSTQLATQARDLFLAALKQPLPFTVPDGITRVKRVNDRLLLTPKLSFLSGRAQLTADSTKTVQELARVLVANAALLEKVELLGFTDARGKRETNVKLSDERALTVRDALVKLGVDTALLEARGLGPERPVADNSTPQGREANRRVEIHLTFKN